MPNPKVPPKTDVKTEEDWEEKVIVEALGDALLPDGSIDFDKLRSTGHYCTITSQCVEGRGENISCSAFDGQGISRKMKSHPATIFENPEQSFALHCTQ